MKQVFVLNLERWGNLISLDRSGLPSGYERISRHWALRLPAGTDPGLHSWSADGLRIEPSPDRDDIARNLLTSWHRGYRDLMPRPGRPIPASTGGLDGAQPIHAEALGVDARRAQIKGYLTDLISRMPPKHEHSAALELFARQLAARPRFAAEKLLHWRDDHGCLHLQFRYSVALHDLPRCKPPPTIPLVSGRLTMAPQDNAPSAAMIACLERAYLVEMAELAMACGLGRGCKLRLQLILSKDDSPAMTLIIPAEGKRLPMMQLSEILATDMAAELVTEESAPAPLILERMEAWPCPGAESKLRRLHGELEWRPLQGDKAPRGIYLGRRNRLGAETMGLPFALCDEPSMHPPARRRAPGYDDLGPAGQKAYRQWLSGSREAEGMTPVIASLYLQGIEYRLLRDAPGTEELPVLGRELARIFALLPPGSDLRSMILRLLDFASVYDRDTGVHPEGQLPELRLLRRASWELTQQGCLEAQTLADLSRLLRPDDPLTPAEIAANPNRARRLPRPNLPLIVVYSSLSGLSDIKRHAVPDVWDLRQFAPLRARLATLAKERAEP